MDCLHCVHPWPRRLPVCAGNLPSRREQVPFVYMDWTDPALHPQETPSHPPEPGFVFSGARP